MEVQDSASGLSLLPMKKIKLIAMAVHVILNSLVLVYHSLETTSSVTLEQKQGKKRYYMMMILCGMGRAVVQIMDAELSTTHHGSVRNLINILQVLMTLSYDCV